MRTRNKNWQSLLFLSVLLLSGACHAVFTVTLLDPGTSAESTYERDLLRLALEKTREKYGDFELVHSHLNPNVARSAQLLEFNARENGIRSFTYSENLIKKHKLEYVRFPIYRGVLGYRTCFTSSKLAPALKHIKTKKDLQQLSQAMGDGWQDEQILEENGIRVFTNPNFDSIFKTVALGRVDLFCRGTSEILYEYIKYSQLPNLAYDKHIAIHYPIPMFFFSSKKNQTLLDRVTEGLKIAYQDGSFNQLWASRFSGGIHFSKLYERKIFYLNNKNTFPIDFDYEVYNFDPQDKDSITKPEFHFRGTPNNWEQGETLVPSKEEGLLETCQYFDDAVPEFKIDLYGDWSWAFPLSNRTVQNGWVKIFVDPEIFQVVKVEENLKENCGETHIAEVDNKTDLKKTKKK